MNCGKTILLPMVILCVIILVAGTVGVVLGLNRKPAEKSFFDYGSEDVFSGDGCRLSEDGLYHAEPVTEFSREGEIAIDAEEDSIKSIRFISTLQNEEESPEQTERICASFLQDVTEKIGFEQYGQPQQVQYCDNETFKHCPEDPYEALLGGYVLFEYTFRDAENALWIVHLYSPAENTLNGMVLKLIDDSEYEGYQAQMEQKEIEE